MMVVTKQTKDNAYQILAALLANPSVCYSMPDKVRLPAGLVEIAFQLSLDMENEFQQLETKVVERKQRLAPFMEEK